MYVMPFMSLGRSGRRSANPNSSAVEVRLSCCLPPTHSPTLHPSIASFYAQRRGKKKKRDTDRMKNNPVLFTVVGEKLVFANSLCVAAAAKSHRGDGEKDRNQAGKYRLEKKEMQPSRISFIISFLLQASLFLTTELPGAASPPAHIKHRGSPLHRRQPMGRQVSGRAAVGCFLSPFSGVCSPVVASPASFSFYLLLHMWRLAGRQRDAGFRAS